MNIFYDKEGILGKQGLTYLKNINEEFFETASSIRKRLETKAYFLDKYLYDLLYALSNTLAYDAADSGFIKSNELTHLCRDIIDGHHECKEHPYYQTVKNYIQEHPLPFQERSTKLEYYFVKLADGYFEQCAPPYFSEIYLHVREDLDIVYLHELYRNICDILGCENDMEKLNLLLRQRYMTTTAMADFAQGLTDSLIYSLTYRDEETSKPVIQLILEEL